MRPIGSTNGRVPPGGYPSVTPAMGGFLAGFIEGEGCFSIFRQTRGYGYKCRISLNARDDDAALINDIAVKTRLGTVRRRSARPTSRPQVCWIVTAKSDCRRLIELLYAYPLRGRKARDFAIWAAAAKWWIGSDPTDRRPSRDWGPMHYLKERLSEAKGYDPLLYDCTDSGPPGLSCDWPDYLAGFTTAEGHLGLTKTPSGVLAPRLTIRMRADEVPLMEQLRDRLQAGKIYGPYHGPGRNPVVNWMILSRDGLERAVMVLDQHPLKGRKHSEYRLWRDAVQTHLSAAASRPAHQRRLASLNSALKAMRAYPATHSD
jgi:hypothetical protein